MEQYSNNDLANNELIQLSKQFKNWIHNYDKLDHALYSPQFRYIAYANISKYQIKAAIKFHGYQFNELLKVLKVHCLGDEFVKLYDLFDEWYLEHGRLSKALIDWKYRLIVFGNDTKIMTLEKIELHMDLFFELLQKFPK